MMCALFTKQDLCIVIYMAETSFCIMMMRHIILNHGYATLVSLDRWIRASQIQPFEAFCPLLRRKSFILADLLRNQTYMLLALLCILWPLVNRHLEIDNLIQV